VASGLEIALYLTQLQRDGELVVNYCLQVLLDSTRSTSLTLSASRAWWQAHRRI